MKGTRAAKDPKVTDYRHITCVLLVEVMKIQRFSHSRYREMGLNYVAKIKQQKLGTTVYRPWSSITRFTFLKGL